MSIAYDRHQIYVQYRSALVDYAQPILGSRETAEDVVQDAYIRFLPAEIRATTLEQAVGFLYRIVRNLALDNLRRRKLEVKGVEQEQPFWLTPVAMPTPEQQLLHAEQVAMIERVLSELPVEMRVVVEMHRFGGFTLEAIARHQNISTATAHRRLRTGLLAIAQKIAAT